MLDRPPWQVTETGWGEFEALISVTFHDVFNEKQQSFPCHLRLHDPATLKLSSTSQTGESPSKLDGAPSNEAGLLETALPSNTMQPILSNRNALFGKVGDMPTIRSELYDEFVFLEPNEALFETCQRYPAPRYDPLTIYHSAYGLLLVFLARSQDVPSLMHPR